MKQEYLLSVPEVQKEWFNKQYGFINDDDFETSNGSWSMLKNNIFGIEDRFLSYKGDSEDLISCFWLSYSFSESSKENIVYFLDCMLMVLDDCLDSEFFEICHNINLIHKKISSQIFAMENN
jgi:hypothetical protein